ncbi:DUF72 domain-containing protein [Caenimonas sedimenti]|uniref:DUF72 domain-containing protein n=1 Tax=Caenimonas sedimenti TaxID=2596921 RepID=A0A562ZJ61_9BURK|nr:DUF72 domain-containing protein [Caenimonas sedimenti]TWO68234.1 DUF72 domain-containing protein [Caenimonas sedimenti]
MAETGVRIGCAGWSLPVALQPHFGAGDSHLARYATRLPAVEINSSFHRPHTRAQYARWAAMVPADFRFCVKLPKVITHELRLTGCEAPLDAFLEQAGGLGARLAALLVQLPPSLAFEARVATAFLETLRGRHTGAIALEPRHASWFTRPAEDLLQSLHMARVLADPVRHAGGERPGGHPGLVYLRLHGSPRVYYSAYDGSLLSALARRISQARDAGSEVWCIFDNTASGAAAANALALRAMCQT